MMVVWRVTGKGPLKWAGKQENTIPCGSSTSKQEITTNAMNKGNDGLILPTGPGGLDHSGAGAPAAATCSSPRFVDNSMKTFTPAITRLGVPAMATERFGWCRLAVAPPAPHRRRKLLSTTAVGDVGGRVCVAYANHLFSRRFADRPGYPDAVTV